MMSPTPKRKRTLVNSMIQIISTQELQIIETRDNDARWIKISQDEGLSDDSIIVFKQLIECIFIMEQLIERIGMST